MSIVCISHKEDVDGICSATIIKAAFDVTSIVLVDYANLIAKLEKAVIHSDKIEKLFICDLGLSKKNEDIFVELLDRVTNVGTEVTYIDHHDIGKETIHAIKKRGVTLIHSVDECTSVQAYNKYRQELPDHAVFFAAMGALTDYMENKPAASYMVRRFDRQFLMLEATALSYMISANQHNDEFLVKMVDTLAKMKYPHDIKGGFEIAEKYARKVSKAVEAIYDSVIKLDSIAYAPSTADLSSSMVVNFVLGSSGKQVAMVYKLKEDINSYIISIRGSGDCKIHLGRIVNEIASGLEGSGGGHDKACGAVVPKDNLQQFISALNEKLSEQ